MGIGDQVEWTKVVKSGSSIKMSQRYGVITEIIGSVAIVKPKKGKHIRIALAKLHVTGSGPNQLTMFIDDAVSVSAKE